jgi:hypothetical protein
MTQFRGGELMHGATNEAMKLPSDSNDHRWGWRRPLLLGLLAALAVSVYLPSAAEAGNYMVYECDPNVSLAAAGTPDFQAGGAFDYSTMGFYNDCGGGNYLLVRALSFRNSGGYGAVWVDAPAGLTFRSLAFVQWQGPTWPCGQSGTTFFGRAQYVFVGGSIIWSNFPQGSCWSNGPGWVSLTNVNATRIQEDISCGGFCIHSEGDWAGYSGIKQFHIEVADSVSPSLQIGGPALEHSVISGQPRLDIAASDVGSGVRSVWVDVNGQRVATPTTDCSGILGGADWASTLRPCGNFSQGIGLDTTQAPFRDGQNTLRVCTADVAMVSGTVPHQVCEQRVLTVDNTCADSQGAQQGLASSLFAGFDNPGGGLSRNLVVYSTQGAKLSGQLRSGGGGPVGGASVCLYEQIDAPAEIRQLSQVTKTRADGGYSLQLPAGPSRDYDVVYRSNDQTLQQQGLNLGSIVVPSLGVGPDLPGTAQTSAHGRSPKIRNGKAARFSGQIPGPYASDRVVALEALIGRGCAKRKHRGRSASAAKRKKRCQPNKWRTFKTLRTDARGRYSGTYRFTQTHGTARYSFRATVPAQAGYPYLEGSSDVQQVTVRGRRR